MSPRRRENQQEFRHINRLVGSSGEADAARARELADDGTGQPVYETKKESFELKEIEKTERDREIIAAVENSVDAVLAKYGRTKAVGIPSDNIHLVESAEVGGYYDARRQQLAVVKERGNSASFAATMFHEMVHAKSFTALKVKVADSGRDITHFRTGLEVLAADGKTRFRELNEAVVQTMTLDFFDREMRQSEFYLADIADAERRGLEPGEKEEASYYVERSILADLLNGLAEVGSGRSRQEIMDVFIRASVNGDVYALRELVESAYGSGSFRVLGESLGEFYRTYLQKKDPGLMERLGRAARNMVGYCSAGSDELEEDKLTPAGKIKKALKSLLK